jgi:hypothetical protein
MTNSQVKLIRFAVIAFSFLLVWLFFKHPNQIPKTLLDAKSIDSITISKEDTFLTIKNSVQITKLSKCFKQMVDYDSKNLRANRGLTHLEIFSKEKTIEIRIIDGIDDGKVIEIDTDDYKNDSLSILIEQLLQHQ